MHRECRERFYPPPRVSDPDTHHGTCVTHVPWCMLGSLTGGFLWSRRRGENVPGIPGACAICNFTYLVGGPWKTRTCSSSMDIISHGCLGDPLYWNIPVLAQESQVHHKKVKKYLYVNLKISYQSLKIKLCRASLLISHTSFSFRVSCNTIVIDGINLEYLINKRMMMKSLKETFDKTVQWLILRIDILNISCEMALRSMPKDITYDWCISVQVIARKGNRLRKPLTILCKNSYWGCISWKLFVKWPNGKCQKTSLMISGYWFR